MFMHMTEKYHADTELQNTELRVTQETWLRLSLSLIVYYNCFFVLCLMATRCCWVTLVQIIPLNCILSQVQRLRLTTALCMKWCNSPLWNRAEIAENTKEKTEAGDMLSFVGRVCKSESSDMTIFSLSRKMGKLWMQQLCSLPFATYTAQMVFVKTFSCKITSSVFLKSLQNFWKKSDSAELQRWSREKASEWKSPLTHNQSSVTLWLLSNADALLVLFRENDRSKVWKYLFNWENWGRWNGGCVMVETGDHLRWWSGVGKISLRNGTEKYCWGKSKMKNKSQRHFMELSFSKTLTPHLLNAKPVETVLAPTLSLCFIILSAERIFSLSALLRPT